MQATTLTTPADPLGEAQVAIRRAQAEPDLPRYLSTSLDVAADALALYVRRNPGHRHLRPVGPPSEPRLEAV